MILPQFKETKHFWSLCVCSLSAEMSWNIKINLQGCWIQLDKLEAIFFIRCLGACKDVWGGGCFAFLLWEIDSFRHRKNLHIFPFILFFTARVIVCSRHPLLVQVSTFDQPMVFTCSTCFATAACLVMQKKKRKIFEAQRCFYIKSQLGKSFQQLNHFFCINHFQTVSMFQCHYLSHLLEESLIVE